MTAPDFAGVLAAHIYAPGYTRGSICTCGFVPDIDPESLASQQDYHRAHVAAALHAELVAWLGSEAAAVVVRQAVQDAWQRGDDDVTAALAALAQAGGGDGE